jgi:hypothetical protein
VALLFESLVCLGKGREHFGEVAGEVAQHARVLRALAGKEQREATRGRTRGMHRTVRQ